MRLITKNGELILPSDFLFTMEYNNPILSNDGDATIPATLPSSKENFKVLEHINRIDRANHFMQSVPAKIEAGVFNQSGQLLIDSASKYNGISVSLAVENSDVYSQFKEKSLKEILVNKVRATWSSVEELATYLINVFFQLKDESDFTIFPVAVSAYEVNDNKVYQFNNETGDGGLIWRSRTVQEGDYQMGVPDGYGLSPFLYLHRLIDILFEEMGYRVLSNCLNKAPYNDIVVLNNCADTIVKKKIKYSNLVPSCTLTEFIEFLFNKFGVHFRVNSTAKTVEVIMIQEVLAKDNPCDWDITEKVDEELDIYISESSRVVLSSQLNMDDTKPAADTLDDLIDKYGFYIEVTEGEFHNIETGNNPVCFDCLVLRKDLGYFYELLRHVGTGTQHLKYIGTNNFKYDRKNSKKTEDRTAMDVIPQMIKDEKRNAAFMYIGERTHCNTTFNGSDETIEQDIMVAWRIPFMYNTVRYTYGTIQKYFNGMKVKPFSLTTYEMYEYFWSNYNNVLRNNKITLKGNVIYNHRDLAMLDMTKLKSYKGQRLLPIKTSFDIGSKLKMNTSEFMLVKDFLDMVKDEPIVVLQDKRLKWQIAYNIEALAHSEFDHLYPSYQYYDGNNERWVIYDTGTPFNQYTWPPDEILVTSSNIICMVLNSITIQYLDGDTTAYIGPPSELYEESFKFNVNYKIILNVTIYEWTEGYDHHQWDYLESRTATYQRLLNNYFIAVPY